MPYISMGLYTADKKFYIADASAKLYRPLPYYVAKVTATTPFQVISALVFTLTVYGMAGMRHGPGADGAAAKNATLSCLVYLIAVQVLHCCALLAPNQDIAFMLSIVWTAIQLLLSSFFIIFSDVFMYWITYLRYLSALYYAFEGTATAEFSGVNYNCSGGLDPTMMGLLHALAKKQTNMHATQSARTSLDAHTAHTQHTHSTHNTHTFRAQTQRAPQNFFPRCLMIAPAPARAVVVHTNQRGGGRTHTHTRRTHPPLCHTHNRRS